MINPPPVKLGDLEDALMFVTGGEMFNNEAWVCRATGKVLWHADEGDWDPVPDDIDDADRYLPVPDKRDLDLGKPLALGFASEHLPECYDQVLGILSRRGAYARFKDLLDRRDRLQAWYQWEGEQTRQALRQWCADNDIPVAD